MVYKLRTKLIANMVLTCIPHYFSACSNLASNYVSYPSSNTARTHAHTSISTLKSLVNFCSRDFLFNKKFDDSTLAKRHIVVGHFVRGDTGHVMQAIDVTRHPRVTQQLVPSTTVLSFVCYSRFVCKKKLLMTFGTNLVVTFPKNIVTLFSTPRDIQLPTHNTTRY